VTDQRSQEPAETAVTDRGRGSPRRGTAVADQPYRRPDFVGWSPRYRVSEIRGHGWSQRLPWFPRLSLGAGACRYSPPQQNTCEKCGVALPFAHKSRGATSDMECGGRRSPMLYQDSWRRRFGSPAQREQGRKSRVLRNRQVQRRASPSARRFPPESRFPPLLPLRGEAKAVSPSEA